ncbi:MAG: sigma-54 dependent transcriptional regulator [Acidobacteria bacterium]|nr:sigma-54 dependent transcriptional regulator [Acidobacteriota bacterium]
MDRSSPLALSHSMPFIPAPRLVVIDEDPQVAEVIGHVARSSGFDVVAFDEVAGALKEMSLRPPHIVLVGVGSPDHGVLDAIRDIGRCAPLCDVVLMTAHATIGGAVDAVKRGAADYLVKPLDLARVTEILADLTVEHARRRAFTALEDDLIRHVCFHGMIGHSPAMRNLFSLIRRMGPHFSTALISGEAGVGKKLVARALHATSKRRKTPLVTLDCSATIQPLFEAERFGDVHVFASGAGRSPEELPGELPAGALLLEEIGELSPAMQTRLLRVLEREETTRAGAADRQSAGVRIIASTNRVLAREVQAGRFRNDLYFRLQVVELIVPPLRERREDLALLARAFVHEFASELEKTIRGVTPDAEHVLASYEWPGNVRELKNVIGRACLLTTREWIDVPDLTVGSESAVRSPGGPVRPMQEVEREQVTRALQETRGNKKEAARRLGISRRAFYRRLEKYGLHPAPAARDAEIDEPAA